MQDPPPGKEQGARNKGHPIRNSEFEIPHPPEPVVVTEYWDWVPRGSTPGLREECSPGVYPLERFARSVRSPVFGAPILPVRSPRLLAAYGRGDQPSPASGRKPAVPLSGPAHAGPAIPMATATYRCRRQVATLAFGYRMAVPGTAAEVAISCSDAISTVPGTDPRARSAHEWARPINAPFSSWEEGRGLSTFDFRLPQTVRPPSAPTP